MHSATSARSIRRSRNSPACTGVRGRAFGLGFGLIMRSDIAIASANTRFALDEVKLGIPPMFIMEQILEHLPAKRALDFILTGREFGADETLQIGLVSRVVGPDDLDGSMGEFVATLRSRDRRVVLACKRYLRAVGKCRSRPARLTRSWNRRNLPRATLSSAES